MPDIAKAYREAQKANTEFFVTELFPIDPSYRDDVEILGKGTAGMRINNYQLISNVSPQWIANRRMEIQELISEEHQVIIGDLLRFDGEYWLCTDLDNFYGLYSKGKIEECNYFLTWQNPATLQLNSCWSVVKDPSSDNYTAGIHVTTGFDRYKLKLPYNSETAQMSIDQRLLIGPPGIKPEAFKIDKIDKISNHYLAREGGFIHMFLEQDQLRPDKDNIELMIADYIDPDSRQPEPAGRCNIKFSGDPIIKSGGGAKTFEAEFLDGYGQKLSGVAPRWWLDVPSGFEDAVDVVSEDGTAIKLKVRLRNDVIGKKFKLKVTAKTADYGDFVDEQEIMIGGMI
jgi:hypothetical protein